MSTYDISITFDSSAYREVNCRSGIHLRRSYPQVAVSIPVQRINSTVGSCHPIKCFVIGIGPEWTSNEGKGSMKKPIFCNRIWFIMSSLLIFHFIRQLSQQHCLFSSAVEHWSCTYLKLNGRNHRINSVGKPGVGSSILSGGIFAANFLQQLSY